MLNRDQHTANGLTFMPVLGYECYFFLFINIWMLLRTNELVVFEKYPIEVQYFKKTTHCLRGIYGIYLQLNKEELKDHNTYLVGLGNTRILTNYKVDGSQMAHFLYRTLIFDWYVVR
jgi:hypothetical protein